jgi:hypothetical protein
MEVRLQSLHPSCGLSYRLSQLITAHLVLDKLLLLCIREDPAGKKAVEGDLQLAVSLV